MNNEWHKNYIREWRKRRKEAGLPIYYKRKAPLPPFKSTPETRRKRAKYMCEYRKREQAKIKEKSRLFANQAVAQGILIPKPCERCGNPKTEMHHSDYEKPFSVRWLCKRCHSDLHKKDSKRVFITHAKGLST